MKRVILLVAIVAVLAATAGCNWAPVISDKLPAQQTLTANPGEVIHFSAVAGDWNSDPLTYKWTATGGLPTSGTGRQFDWTAPAKMSTSTVTIAVSDGTWTTTHSWTVVVGFKESFETGSTGWTATGLWHRQVNDAGIFNAAVPYYVPLPTGDVSSRIPFAYSGQYCYWYGSASGEKIQGNYMGAQVADEEANSGGTSTSSNYGTLTSPIIDLGDLQNPVLQFAYWYEIEGQQPKTNDLMEVYISVNGGSFTWAGKLNPIFVEAETRPYVAYTSGVNGGLDTPASWDFRYVVLRDYVGQKIQVQFRFDTVDVHSNGFRGWFIDDVEIIDDATKNHAAKEINQIRDYSPNLR